MTGQRAEVWEPPLLLLPSCFSCKEFEHSVPFRNSGEKKTRTITALKNSLKHLSIA
jgi:hypothetical protein